MSCRVPPPDPFKKMSPLLKPEMETSPPLGIPFGLNQPRGLFMKPSHSPVLLLEVGHQLKPRIELDPTMELEGDPLAPPRLLNPFI